MSRLASLEFVLRTHQAADEREQGYLARMLSLAARGEPSFSRNHFDPGHFTASAFVLSPDRRSVLLILHSKLGLWLQPGGHFDIGDVNVLAAARREVTEETGISDLKAGLEGNALLDIDIHKIPPNSAKGEPAHEHFDLRFLFVAPSLNFSAGSDALEACWVQLRDVEDAGTDDSVRRAIRKLRALG